MATQEEVTITDAQLADMREAISKAEELECEREVIILTANIQVEDDLVVRLMRDPKNKSFVVVL